MKLVEKQAAARRVGLKPFAVDHHLRDRTPAHVADHLFGGGGVRIHIDFGVRNSVPIEELLGGAAVAAPCRAIDLDLHDGFILPVSMAPAQPQAPVEMPYYRRMTAEDMKRMLDLKPHPEGGFYRQTYISGERIGLARGARALGTAIYYLLEPGTFSEMHMIDSDEVFHFYLGDPVEMLQLHASGSSAVLTLGQNLAAGEQVQVVVPAGVWQGTRLVEGGKVALLGCTVSPGFDFDDYRSGSYAELAEKWPAEKERIGARTRS